MDRQVDRIGDYLRRGHVLTALSALNLFGCMRLAARVHQLRELGVAVKTDRVKLRNGKVIAGYRL